MFCLKTVTAISLVIAGVANYYGPSQYSYPAGYGGVGSYTPFSTNQYGSAPPKLGSSYGYPGYGSSSGYSSYPGSSGPYGYSGFQGYSGYPSGGGSNGPYGYSGYQGSSGYPSNPVSSGSSYGYPGHQGYSGYPSGSGSNGPYGYPVQGHSGYPSNTGSYGFQGFPSTIGSVLDGVSSVIDGIDVDAIQKANAEKEEAEPEKDTSCFYGEKFCMYKGYGSEELGYSCALNDSYGYNVCPVNGHKCYCDAEDYKGTDDYDYIKTEFKGY